MALKVPRDLLPDLMRRLGKEKPETIAFYYAADNVTRGDVTMVSFWVDQWPDFQAVVKCVDTNIPEFPYYETCRSVWAIQVKAAMEMMHVKELFDWSKPFLSRVLSDAAMEAMQTVAKGRGHLRMRPKDLYAFQGDQRDLPVCDIPDGFTLGELHPEVSDYLSHRYCNANISASSCAPYIHACLSRLPTSCVYDSSGQIAAYAFLHFNGGLGCVETLEQWRRLGLGHAVVADICRKVLRRGQQPFVYVGEDNEAGKAVYSSVGMVKVGHANRCHFTLSAGS